MVGYQPTPAISAGTVLAFFLDDAPGAPPSTVIPKGTKVQTVPRAGETAVVFETAAETSTKQGDVHFHLLGLEADQGSNSVAAILRDLRRRPDFAFRSAEMRGAVAGL